MLLSDRNGVRLFWFAVGCCAFSWAGSACSLALLLRWCRCWMFAFRSACSYINGSVPLTGMKRSPLTELELPLLLVRTKLLVKELAKDVRFLVSIPRESVHVRRGCDLRVGPYSFCVWFS